MISKKIISKSIDEAIIKCRATDNAKKLGASCVISEDENNNQIFTYEDGTTITFDRNYNLLDISFGDTDYSYYGDKSYDEFEYQKESLMSTVDGEEPDEFQKTVGVVSDWEYLLEFADDFATVHGWMINGELRKGIDVDSENYQNSWLDDTDALADHEWFVNLENKTLADHDNYCALRITTTIHDNEDLSKRIVQDKAHYSTSVGGDMAELLRGFGNYKGVLLTSSDFRDSWKTVTLVKKDSGVRGVFLGTALNEGRHAESTVMSDWEAELNFPPKMKFERLIIDEKNKIIIQTPKVTA